MKGTQLYKATGLRVGDRVRHSYNNGSWIGKVLSVHSKYEIWVVWETGEPGPFSYTSYVLEKVENGLDVMLRISFGDV